MFNTSRNKSSSQVLKSCKSVQETSKEVLFIKTRQISTNNIYQGLMLVLNSFLIETFSIENYEIQISRPIFTHIEVYLWRVSFLITLDVYMDYFKGYQR